MQRHGCLLPGYDVLFEICRYFYPQLTAESWWPDLASRRMYVIAMTRTCRAFYEPAMDVLWYGIPDVSPVMRTLPAELWEEEATVPSNEDSGVHKFIAIVSALLYLFRCHS